MSRPVERLGHLSIVGQIGGQGMTAGLGGKRLERFGGPRQRPDLQPFGDQRFHDLGADAARRTGHQRGSVFVVLRHGGLPSLTL